MSVNSNASYENRIGLPAVLLSLCLLALVVSLFGLFRTSGLTESRVSELQMSWQALLEDGVEGSEIVATNRLMQGVVRPVPATHSAASWSLALGAASLVFFGWLLLTIRSVQRSRSTLENQDLRNEQAATAKLLDEIAPLASGDLGVRASATDGTAGALAYAFNHAVSELQRLAEIQLSTSRALSESVGKSHESAAAIERHCAQQTEHIHHSSNALLQFSSSSGSWSANTAETTDATQTVVAKVDDVLATVKASRRQIDGMRRDSGLSLGWMQSLYQYVHPVEDSFAQLEDLARHTELLAVNTSIRASTLSTDHTPEDVVRLTDEVARLGDALRAATDDVRSLLLRLKTESAEAISSMQRVQLSVDTQSAEMGSVTEALEDICTNARVIQSHTELMAEQGVVHAGVVKTLSENMNLINQITEQTGRDAQTNAASMEVLKKMANDLRQSTSDYSIPDSQDGEAGKTGKQPAKSFARRAAERASING